MNSRRHHRSEVCVFSWSLPVDAVVIEFHLGLLDGGASPIEIKRVRPELPIVMLATMSSYPSML